MKEFDISLINGMMLGLEFPPVNEIDEDLKFAVVVDFLILRFTFLIWRTAE